MTTFALASALAASACDGSTDSRSADTNTAPTRAETTIDDEPTEEPMTDAQTFNATLEDRVEQARERAESQKSWLEWQTVATLRLEQARLTGDNSYREKADAALARALELVKTPPASLLVLRARMAQTDHRFDEAKADLEAADKQPLRGIAENRDSRSIRGIIAWQAGDAETARKLWEELWEEKKSASTALLLADLHEHLGETEKAEHYLAEAVKLAESEDDYRAAWILVQRGLYDLDHGRYAEANKHYEAADARFSGWYLVEEHLAETLALTGEKERAAKIYDDVVGRVPDPELMAAYAGVLRDLGRAGEAAELEKKAKTALMKAIEEDPQGMSGHAVDLLIEWDPPKAVELARADYALRPGPSSRVQLVAALHAAESYDEAWTLIEPMLEEEWRSGRMYDLAAKLLEQRGDAEAAAGYREKARAWDASLKT